MWVTKIKFKHDCLFGGNCEKAQATCMSIPFNSFKKEDRYFVYHFGTAFGENFEKFLKLLKTDKRTVYFENDGSTFFLIEKRAHKETPGAFNNPQLIPVKPVFMDKEGYETWEIAAIKKETLMEFIKHFSKAKIYYIKQTSLKDIYFPRLSPNLTILQRNAFELAREQGFYDFPKRTNLDKLSKIAKVSKPTFREHLKRAEKKILNQA